MVDLVKSLIRPGLNGLRDRLEPSVVNWSVIDVSLEPATVADVGAARGNDPLLKQFSDAGFIFVSPLVRYNSNLRNHRNEREGEIVNVAIPLNSPGRTVALRPTVSDFVWP